MTVAKRASKRNSLKPGSKTAGKGLKRDLEQLDGFKNKMFERFETLLNDSTYIPKVGDLVKIIELQRKLSSDSEAEGQFWEFIERLRQEELKHA